MVSFSAFPRGLAALFVMGYFCYVLFATATAFPVLDAQIECPAHQIEFLKANPGKLPTGIEACARRDATAQVLHNMMQ